MGFSRKQAWALFMAVLMVGSILGIVGLSGQNDQDNLSNVPPELPSASPTAVTYEASVPATVVELFPIAVLVAKSSDFELTTANEKLLAIPEVVTLTNSQFLDNQPTSENYRAEIRFTSPEDIEIALEAINQIDAFSGVSMFPQALVSIPSIVEFQNTGLDIALEHSFDDPKSQAYVTVGTQKHDELLVSLNATFQGQELVNLLGFEEQNLTSSPQIYFLEESFPISSFENEFLVRTTSSLPERENLESVKTFLEENNNVDSSTIQVSQVSNSLNVSFSDPSSFFEQDLNTALSSFEGVENFSIAPDSSAVIIYINQDVEYPSFKSSLEEELNSLGFDVASITDPVITLQGNISSESKEKFLESISSASEQYSIELDYSQKAIIQTDSLFIPDANTSFPLNDGSFPAFVKPDREVGNEVNLSMIVFASTRDGITDVQAQEIDETAIEPEAE